MKHTLKSLLFAAVFLNALALSAAQDSASDPVDELAEGRFEFQSGGETFVIPCNYNVAIDEVDEDIRHLIVMVHGFLRRPHYQKSITDALEYADIQDGVAVVSPQFLTSPDILAHDLGNEYPYWSKNGWTVGHLSRNDNELPRAGRVSTFEVVDRLLERALEIFPRLETITVAGFSAGGRFVNRYAAGNRADGVVRDEGVNISYVVASPSSYLYFDKERPVSFEPLRFGPVSETAYPDSKSYNTYRYGLDSLNSYMKTTGADKIPDQYEKREVYYLIGALDDERASKYLSVSEQSMIQGKDRLQRAKAYHGYLGHLFGDGIYGKHHFAVVKGAGHNSREVFISPEGVQALIRSMGLPEGEVKALHN